MQFDQLFYYFLIALIIKFIISQIPNLPLFPMVIRLNSLQFCKFSPQYL